VHVRLTVKRGRSLSGRHYVIAMCQRLVIGRGHDVSVRLEDDRISRRHTSLELTPEGVLVTDLGSRNGTFLDAARLEPNTAVKPKGARSTLRVGKHELTIELEGGDEETVREAARTWDLSLVPRDEFKILDELGRGSMGVVYAAREKLLGRNVAVKVLSQQHTDEHARERFLREGRLCCRIKSPHVVEVHYVRVVRGRIFLVMELVSGLSLRACMENDPPGLETAIRIGAEIASGLVDVHAASVVHRDVKPANILLTPEGTAKLGDFGIAKLDRSVSESLEALTSTGEGMGTLYYIPPEQLTNARDVDARADVYSLGATLYYMLSGRHTFQVEGLSPVQVLELLMAHEPAPLVSVAPECPEDLARLVHSMLAKSAGDRPDSSTVHVELRRLQEAHPEEELGPSTDDMPPLPTG